MMHKHPFSNTNLLQTYPEDYTDHLLQFLHIHEIYKKFIINLEKNKFTINSLNYFYVSGVIFISKPSIRTVRKCLSQYKNIN
jgi:hypothetical protein